MGEMVIGLVINCQKMPNFSKKNHFEFLFSKNDFQRFLTIFNVFFCKKTNFL